MTTAAASWLQSKDWAEVALVLLVDGLDLAYTNHDDTSGLTSAWNTATGGLWTNIRGGLEIDGSIESTVRIFNAQINPSSLTFTLHDTDNTLIGKMFAEADTSAHTVDLGASVDSRYGLISSAQDNSAFSSSGEIYVGTETIIGIKGTNTWLGRRGYRSIAGTYANHDFGQPHNVSTITGDQPQISDRPQKWINRNVGLFLCHKVGDAWSAGLPGSSSNDAELLWFGRITNYADDGTGKVVLNCIDILDKLKTSIFANAYSGNLAEGLYILSTDTEVKVQYSYTTSAGATTTYPAHLETLSGVGTWMTHSEVVSGINAILNDIFITNSGTYAPAGSSLKFVMGPDNKYQLTLSYTITGTNQADGVLIWLAPRIWALLGFDHLGEQAGTPSGTSINGNLVYAILDDSQEAGSITIAADGAPFRFASFLDPQRWFVGSSGLSYPRIEVTDSQGVWADQTRMPTMLPANEATGFLLIGKQLFAVIQEATDTFAIVRDVSDLLGGTLGNNNIQDLVQQRDDGSGVVVPVSQVWLEVAPIGDTFLRLLASTGTSGYNHPTYDTMPQQLGIGVPWELLDYQSILGMGTDPYVLYINGATPFIKLFESALNFCAKNFVWKNGKLTVVSFGEGVAGASSLVSLTEDNKAKQAAKDGARAAITERTTCERNPDGIINRATLRYQYGLDKTFSREVTVNATTSQTDYGQIKSISIDGYGIYEDLSLNPGGSIKTWEQQTAAGALSYFSKPIAVARRSYDFSLATQLFCGSKIQVTDSYLVDPSTGTRGVTNLLAWVTGINFNWTTGVGVLTFVFQPATAQTSNTARLIGPYGPSGMVDKDYPGSGFSGGYNSSTKKLAILPHAYGALSEQTDINNFVIGDKVHVVELSPANPASPKTWTDVIAGLDAANNLITLTTGLAAFDATLHYVIEYNTITNDTSSQRAHSFIADSTTLSTGLATKDAYRWAADPDSSPSESFLFQQRYRKIENTTDDTGTPLSVHKLNDLSLWANTAIVHHTAPYYANQPLTQAITYGTGSHRRLVYGPLPIPLYYGKERQLEVRLLAANTAANGATVKFNVITSIWLPNPAGSANFDDSTYLDVNANSQNLNWIQLQTSSSSYGWLVGYIPVPAALPGIPPWAWFYVEATADGGAGTAGLKHVFLREWSETLAPADLPYLPWANSRPPVAMLYSRRWSPAYLPIKNTNPHIFGNPGFNVQRFYLPASHASTPASTVDGSSSWGSTTGSTYNFLLPGKVTNTPTNSFAQGSTISWTGSSSITALDRRYVGPPMVGQTISGSVKAYRLAKEGASGAHARTRLGIHVVSNDGATLRGTLLTIGEYGVAADLNTANRNKSWASSGTSLSSLAVQNGDRLVVDYGYADVAGTTPNASAQYGASAATGTDLAENETATASANSWIEFSNNIRLQQVLPAFLTNTFTGTPPTSGTFTPTANTPQLVYVASSTSGAPPPVPNIPSLSTTTNLSFTQVGTVYMDPTGAAQKFRLTVFYAPGVQSPTAGTVSYDFGGQTQAGSKAFWYQMRGATDAVTQSFFDSTISGNPATNGFSISLTNAPAADSACFAIFVYNSGFGGTMSCRSGWDWVDQAQYVTIWRPNGDQTASVNTTLATNKWCAAILELTAA